MDVQSIISWLNKVEEGYVENIENAKDKKVEVKVVDKVSDGGASDIKEIEGWEVNMGQWENSV